MESLTPHLRTFWRLDFSPVYLGALSSVFLLSVCEFCIFPKKLNTAILQLLQMLTELSLLRLMFVKSMCTIKCPTPSRSSSYYTSERHSVCRFIHPHPSLLVFQSMGPLLSCKTTKLREGQDRSVFIGWVHEYPLWVKTVCEKQNINHEQNWKRTYNFSLKNLTSWAARKPEK